MPSLLETLSKKRQTIILDSCKRVEDLADAHITQDAHDRFVDHYLNIWPPTFAHLFGRFCYAICTACTNTKNANAQWTNARKIPWETQEELARALLVGGCHNKKAACIFRVLDALALDRPILGHPIRDMGIKQADINDPAAVLTPWLQARERLSSIKGIGWKLASMTLQMFDPFDCPLLIVDTWFGKNGWYSVDPEKHKEYRIVEDHWIRLCQERGWVTGIAREIFWDKVGQKRLYDPTNAWWTDVVVDAPVTPLIDWLRDMPYPAPAL